MCIRDSPESVDRGYLTQKEIQTLMDAPMKNATHELVRDLFVLDVYKRQRRCHQISLWKASGVVAAHEYEGSR